MDSPATATRGEAQDDGAGESGQIAELAGAETEAGIGGMPPRQPIGARRQAQRPHMGRHVHAVGQQRHGVVEKARADLHHHEQGGNQRRQLGAGFRPVVAMAEKDMAMSPDAVIVRIMIVRAGVNVIVRHGPIVPFKRLKAKPFSAGRDCNGVICGGNRE